MSEQIKAALRSAEEAVTELVTACRKDDPLYRQNPKCVAQVSRTGKWLLNAINQLRRELTKPQDEPLAQKE